MNLEEYITSSSFELIVYQSAI